MRSLQPMPPTRTSRVAATPSQRRLLLLPLRPEHHRLSDATNVLSPSGHLPLSWRPKEVEQVRRTTAATDSISRLIRSAIVAEGGAGSFRTQCGDRIDEVGSFHSCFRFCGLRLRVHG